MSDEEAVDPEAHPIEEMRALAEQAAFSEQPDRPEWLPENFKTPEALVASYKEAQRKITEETTARRNLEAEIEELRASQISPYAGEYDGQQLYDQAVDDQAPYEGPPAGPPVDVQAVARQALHAKLVEQAAPQIAAQAEQLAAGAVPGYDSEAVRVEVTAHPEWIAGVAGAGDPAQLAGALVNVHNALQARSGPSQADLMRTMKIQAQSAVGAGGRQQPVSDSESRWAEIMNANTGTWSEAVRRAGG